MCKRVISLILGVLAVCGCVISCSGGDDVDIYEMLLELCETGGNAAQGDAVFYADEEGAEENDGFRVRSKEDFGFLYDGIFAAPACYDRIEGYAIRLPLDDSGFEVHIIECVNVSDATEVMMMLQRRVDKMQNAEILEYAPENYEICFRGAIVCSRGRYAFLVSTYDNEAVKEVIKRRF